MNFTKHLAATSIAAAALLLSSAAQADLRVDFKEGAPKDAFRFENIGVCSITNSSITLDLATSSAGLIFDVTDQGAGVEVFQPFELIEGADALARVPDVLDGQTKIELSISDLAPGAAIAFTIDVDDTKGQRAITVSGSEIEGATVIYRNDKEKALATFSSVARASVTRAC
ncbi:aggregation factor core [uncultured Roseibium sp.]|uniref:aggregation factor core n=1 Tax=uncultured Roseibium sp. TaxID=1936171 RepID=UPI00262EFBE5|nr:aggregation factor core [uncultured Roseibium sp.]